MSILHDNLLRIKILLELDKKINDPSYYTGEKDLRDWLMPAYELHVQLKIKREDYERVRIMMMDRDEIGSTIQKGTEFIYLKKKGLLALYGRKRSEAKKNKSITLLPSFVEAYIRKVYLLKA